MILVKFIKSSTPYMAGETAGFADAQAKALIARGVALAVGGSAPVAAVIAPAQIVTKPMPASAPDSAEFDPTNSPIADVRACLKSHGASFGPRTSEDKLREMALELLTK